MDYRVLILAGYGCIGRGFFTLGEDLFSRFEQIWVIDRAPCFTEAGSSRVRFFQGEVENLAFLSERLKETDGPFVFINTCSGTDNYRLRKLVAHHGGAYLDTACSTIHGREEHRFSRLMPYSFSPVSNNRPHFICCGANPGMVELVARWVIYEFFQGASRVDVHFFEHDSFKGEAPPGKVAASWSVETLVDEVMLSPPYWVSNGKEVEGERASVPRVDACWSERVIPSLLVGHEELWAIRKLKAPEVRDAFFCYAFDGHVMELLEGDPQKALDTLVVPAAGAQVRGVDRIAVKVTDVDTCKSKIFTWAVSHDESFISYGLSAVQYQVAASILVFLESLFFLDPVSVGTLYCGSTLPIEKIGWDLLFKWMKRYGVEWVDSSGMELQLACFNSGMSA